MRVAVIGLGISGKAAANYLQKEGHEVIGVERNPPHTSSFPVFSDHLNPLLDQIDLCVKSPGISQTHRWVQEALNKQIPIVGEIDLAFQALQKRNKRLLAITGSNGKTTTTLMCTHLLHQNGTKALAAGNVGIPLISQVDSDAQVFVVELSSFQLQFMRPLPLFDGAVILNITPNHLDHHASFEEYLAAKLQIINCLKKSGSLFLSQQVLEQCGPIYRPYQILDQIKEKVASFLSLSYRDSHHSLFPHDVDNAVAAFLLADISLESLKKGLETFVKPPHRLEFVQTDGEVTYINDSKATSIDSVIKAVEALPGPIFLLAGGVDKGGNYRDWLPYFKNKVLRVFIFGQASDKIEQALIDEIAIERVFSLSDAVRRASLFAKGIGKATVLLSPGCSSYDQFRDYQHRGETFKEIVAHTLKGNL